MHLGRMIAIGNPEELRRQSGTHGPLESAFLSLTAAEANFTEERSPA
jgi:hypothetical protein